jgi:hypothetical protein
MLQPRNNGIMESWNDGMMGFQRILSILNFIGRTHPADYLIMQYPKPIFPLFQHYTIPIGAEHLT